MQGRVVARNLIRQDMDNLEGERFRKMRKLHMDALEWASPLPLFTGISKSTNRARSTSRSEKVDTIDRLQRSHSHSYRGRVQFGLPVVDFVTSLPDAIVGGAVSTLDIEDQVLNKIDFIRCVDDQHARGGHLGQSEQEN